MTSPSLRSILLWLAATCLAGASQAHAVEDVQLRGHARIAATSVSGMDSFVSGDWGKYAEDDGEALQLESAFVSASVRLRPTLQLKGSVEVHSDPEAVALNELYLHYRPLPRGRWRGELRFGTYYPAVSFTNRGAGWRARAANSFSAIDTWLAEEVRSTGLEASGSVTVLNWHVTARAGALVGNDVAGAQMAWKGWSSHARQTGIGERVALPPFAAGRAGGTFERQSSRTDPFRELDDRIGYSGMLEVRSPYAVRALVGRWNNRADPRVFEDGNYGWDTSFDTASVEWRSKRMSLIGQWMRGRTGMGRSWQGELLVDARFRAVNGLLTLTPNPAHRLTVRYDKFWVSDRDDVADDDSSECGDIWTVSYSFEPSGSPWRYGAELQRTESWRPQRRVEVNAREDRVSIFAERQFKFGTRR